MKGVDVLASGGRSKTLKSEVVFDGQGVGAIVLADQYSQALRVSRFF